MPEIYRQSQRQAMQMLTNTNAQHLEDTRQNISAFLLHNKFTRITSFITRQVNHPICLQFKRMSQNLKLFVHINIYPFQAATSVLALI